MKKKQPTNIQDLVHDDRNANKHTKTGMALLDKGLTENGLGRSILISSDNKIIAGNGVTERAKARGISKVRIIDTTGDELIAVRRQDILSGTREFYNMALSDNLIAQANIAMDAEVTNAIAEEFGLQDWAALVTTKEQKAEDDNFKIKIPIKAQTYIGDVYEFEQRHRLMCGDSRNKKHVDHLTMGRKFDMVNTDPPYNVDYEGGTGMKIMNDKMSDAKFKKFLADFYTTFAEATKPGGAWYVWHADSEGLNFREQFKEAGLMMKQTLIWVKSSIVMGRQDYQWKHEPCLYGWKPGASHYFTEDRTKSTVYDDKVDFRKLKKPELLQLLNEILGEKIHNTVLYYDKPSSNDLHPTMKPVPMIGEQISNSSKPGQIVGDGFGGSGTCMVAAEQLNRIAYLMENDPKFCDVTVERMIRLSLAKSKTPRITKNGRELTAEDLTKYLQADTQ